MTFNCRIIVCLILMPLLAGLALPTAAATPVLRVLAWPGYVEPEVIEEFQKRHKVSVEVTVVDNDDTLLEKMRIGAGSGSGNFDLVAANTAEISRYAGAGWLQPIALNDIPARAGQAPRFLDYAGLPGLMQGGRVYGIPFTYAEMGLIYDRKAFVQPPDSIAVLWDERYRKKVLAFNGSSHNFSLAALRLGRPSPFNLAERDWPLAVDQLIALRRNVLVFYTQPEESADLFIRHKAVLMYANYGRQQLKLLTDRHADVGYVIPAEGALAWLDCWAITRGAGNVRLAHAFIDHMLGATASRLLESRQGLSSTKKAISMPAGKERQLHWLMPVENAEERTRLWQRILSGDTRNRVLQP